MCEGGRSLSYKDCAHFCLAKVDGISACDLLVLKSYFEELNCWEFKFLYCASLWTG